MGDRDVTADEYLYWLAASCDAIYQYYGITDWSLAMTGDLTVADFAKEQADYYVSQRVAVELLAKEQEVALTETQQSQLDTIEEYYAEYYGSAEVYQYLMDFAGLNKKTLQENSAVPFLYSGLCQKLLGEGGALEPTQENLDAYAQRNDYTDLKMCIRDSASCLTIWWIPPAASAMRPRRSLKSAARKQFTPAHPTQCCPALRWSGSAKAPSRRWRS